MLRNTVIYGFKALIVYAVSRKRVDHPLGTTTSKTQVLAPDNNPRYEFQLQNYAGGLKSYQEVIGYFHATIALVGMSCQYCY